jgi:hypothetical protein
MFVFAASTKSSALAVSLIVRAKIVESSNVGMVL